MSYSTSPAAVAARLHDQDSRLGMTVAGMAGILLIIPFFTYICYKGRTVAGKVEFRVSITTGPAANPRASHTANGQEPTTGITNTSASAVHSNPSQGPIATPANAFPITASTTNTGASGMHGNLPQTQQPNQTGAPQHNSRNIPRNGTGAHNAPSQSPGTFSTGASHDASRRRNNVGINYQPPNGIPVQVRLGYDEKFFGLASMP